MGPGMLQERKPAVSRARHRLRGRCLEILRDRVENREAEHRTYARAVVDCDGPLETGKCGGPVGPKNSHLSLVRRPRVTRAVLQYRYPLDDLSAKGFFGAHVLFRS